MCCIFNKIVIFMKVAIPAKPSSCYLRSIFLDILHDLMLSVRETHSVCNAPSHLSPRKARQHHPRRVSQWLPHSHFSNDHRGVGRWRCIYHPTHSPRSASSSVSADGIAYRDKLDYRVYIPHLSQTDDNAQVFR